MFLFRAASSRQIDIGLLIIRLVVGLIFTAHGGQKLFVYGFDGVAAGFAQMGVPIPQLMGPLVALLEFSGGFALIAGLLTRLVAVGLAVTMVVAMLLVHLKAGFFNPDGIEFTLSLLGSTLLLVLAGSGSYSLDALIGTHNGGNRTGLETVAIKRAA